MKRLLTMAILTCLITFIGNSGIFAQESKNIVVAYVTSWSNVIPNPHSMTHINYAFGHVNEEFNGVKIDNPKRLKEIVKLKRINPHLKVTLSIGGWGSGRFSEMVADDNLRLSFAKECKSVVDKFNLDGIDIDWEYPTSSVAKISSSPDDTKNFTLLMRDIRAAIGEEKELTLATIASAQYIDFKAILPYIDFVNIMSYDLDMGEKHHSPLYNSEITPEFTVSKAVDAHLAAGVPAKMLTMGMPIYGRGTAEWKKISRAERGRAMEKYEEKWDEKGKIPYLVNGDGEYLYGFDNERSLQLKCSYIKERGLLGGMYWCYPDKGPQERLTRFICYELMW